MTAANPTRIRVAARMPMAMTRVRSLAGRPAATSPTTMALSPGEHEIDDDDLKQGAQLCR